MAVCARNLAVALAPMLIAGTSRRCPVNVPLMTSTRFPRYAGTPRPDVVLAGHAADRTDSAGISPQRIPSSAAPVPCQPGRSLSARTP
jgi:hypothetical protein